MLIRVKIRNKILGKPPTTFSLLIPSILFLLFLTKIADPVSERLGKPLLILDLLDLLLDPALFIHEVVQQTTKLGAALSEALFGFFQFFFFPLDPLF